MNIAALPVLPGIATLTIAANNNNAGIAAADECSMKWPNPGCDVYIVSESDSYRLRREPQMVVPGIPTCRWRKDSRKAGIPALPVNRRDR
ncbi:hypothetical protein VSR34_21690 [Paraburkholderia sp. JHI2823]|uniref:hypothetical protein n=1 Tax=Paraburkholderia sp. JHI2823 TaxID=3112960 RepID=UPI0031827917